MEKRNKLMGRTVILLLCVVGVIWLFVQVSRHMAPIMQGEPDTYFELAIAKKMVSEGLVRQWPQVEDLGWAERYPEKNFLYTALVGVAYRLGGEVWALQLTPFLSLILLLSIFFWVVAFERRPIGIGLGLVVVLLATPDFASRLVLFRPHLLGMILFLWLLFGVVKQWPVFNRRDGRALRAQLPRVVSSCAGDFVGCRSIPR